MNVKYLIFTVLETIVKVVIIAAVIVFIMRAATEAYDFGYRVFADQPVSVSGGRTITIGVAQDASVKDVAKMLEEKGLIEDADLFVVQELLSAYHGKILPGIYDLSTNMTAQNMLEIMSTPANNLETGGMQADENNDSESNGGESDDSEGDGSEGDGSEGGSGEDDRMGEDEGQGDYGENADGAFE